MATDGIVQAPQFVSHAAFEGGLNNSTHLRLKQESMGVLRPLKLV